MTAEEDEHSSARDEEMDALEKYKVLLRRADCSESGGSGTSEESTDQKGTGMEEDGQLRIHTYKAKSEENDEIEQQLAATQEKAFRKKLNQDTRKLMSHSPHQGVKLIVHRPKVALQHQLAYEQLSKTLLPVILEIARKTQPLLVHEQTMEFAKNHYYGSKFQADHVVYQDFRYFSKKRPPTESPSLVVGIRVDESASMSAFGRLEAAKQAVVAVYEFCQICQIPVMIYGDTADASKMEQMSIFAYVDWEKADEEDPYRLMHIQARSNNRDGMALKAIAEKLSKSTAQTKLLISISDGQPKAMENYTGDLAMTDMHQTISEYERKGVTFVAAAIGQDKEVIEQIYGEHRYLDITDLKSFPAQLVRVIARYL